MSFNIQPSGRDCWDGSPSLDAHDQPSLTTLAFHPAKPTVLETELNSGRPEHPSAVSGADHPSQWPASPTDEMPPSAEASSPASSPELFQVDLGAWYPRYLACMQYFLDHSQHHSAVQSLATFLNIRLPFQRMLEPVYCYSSPSTTQSQNTSQDAPRTVAPNVCLRTYIRRLIVTAHDMPPVLQAFFGPDWMAGLEGIWKQERINYMFAAKSAGWASTKEAYDILPDEHAPFVRPIRAATEEELRTAESQWSEWLAMEDWMVGPRSPW